MRIALSIAGSDPSGGAGIQADLKTFAAFGVYGCTAITAVTAQNTVSVSAVHILAAESIHGQLDAVFSDVTIDAVKVGMLGDVSVVRAVAAALRQYQPPHIVVDPVLMSGTGAPLLNTHANAVLRDELLPLATLVTPNADEAG